MTHLCAGALLVLGLAAGCGKTRTPQSSSGSHWLQCEVNADCSERVPGARCKEGFCVDSAGDRIETTVGRGGSGGRSGSGANSGSGGRAEDGGSQAGAGGAGSGSGGQDAGERDAGAGSGSGGASGGGGTGGSGGSGSYEPCAGKACGDNCSLCPPSDPTCIETDEVKRCDVLGDCTGSPVECSGGVVALPDCAGTSDGDGSRCTWTTGQSPPQCCEGSVHLSCMPEGCTASTPGNCFGTFRVVVGSVCEPPRCDPAGLDTCGAGQACCEVGRCGPVVRDEGQCERASTTGTCEPCACESQPGGCPRCNSPGTPIATPDGERAIEELREGDLVLSLDHGELVAVPVLATAQVRVHDHAVVRLSLDNGRAIEVSGSHPTADGVRLDALAIGDAVGGVRVVSAELIPYAHDRTYDLLPASDSGTYLAAGALLRSTLSPCRRCAAARPCRAPTVARSGRGR